MNKQDRQKDVEAFKEKAGKAAMLKEDVELLDFVVLIRELTWILGRPARIGNIGEYLASRIFDIDLEEKENNPGSDGKFNSGRLAGDSVNVKIYGRRTNILDICKDKDKLPDHYLVLAGPKDSPAVSRGTANPWCIDEVFLFEARPLLDRLEERGVKIGIATSVIEEEWRKARIYPVSQNPSMQLSKDQQEVLRLFGSANNEAGATSSSGKDGR